MTFTNRRTNHIARANATPDVEILEREVRVGIPLGSSMSTTENFLAKRGIEFNVEASSKTFYVITRKLKGSTAVVNKALQLEFHFDEASKLKYIESKVLYTGP